MRYVHPCTKLEPNHNLKGTSHWVWWLVPGILALRRLRQEDCCKFKASPDYGVTAYLKGQQQQQNKRASEKGQWVSMLAAKPGDVSSIPGTQVKEEGESGCHKVVL